MALHSENGWPVLGHTDLRWFTAAGVRFAAANADVATIGQYLIERFHSEVEPITGGIHDDWSFAVRNVRGSTTIISNHSSATAWDLNAVRHPRRATGTFTAAEIRRLRNILADITDDSGDHVIRWGGDFKTVVDAMHLEIHAGGRSVHQAAEKIRAARAAQEDDVKDSDKADIAREVVRLLSATANIPNQALHPGEPAAANFTLPGALSNVEKNQDQENERTAADRLADSVTRKQVAEIHAAVVKPPAR
jgi:hypothetical protein